MSLLGTRDYYKPFDYPWMFDYYVQQNQMMWLPEDVPLHNDVKDWQDMEESEKNLLTQIFRLFTQSDVDVASGYIDKYMRAFKKPEARMMMCSFANMESIHQHAYSLLLDTVNMPDTEYKAFSEYEAMADKHDYINAVPFKVSNKEKIVRDMAVFSAFGEGLQLFASFVMLLNFPRFGKMKGMGQIVAWSIRDESHHVENMIKLLHCVLDEMPHVWHDDFKATLYQICREMVDLEDKFIDLAFNLGPVEGLEPDDVKQYIRHIADRRLLQLGLKPNYGVKDNPLEWVDWVVSGVEHTNFFENKATEYAKGTLTGTWDEAF